MNHFEQIEAYLSGAMVEQEKALFEQQLQQDAALRRDFEEWLQTEAIIAKHEAAEANLPEIKKTLSALTRAHFGKSAHEQKGKLILFRKYVYAAMAAAAILLFFILMPGGIDNYNIAPMPGAVVRGAEDAGKKGGQLFNEGKYAEALPYLRKNANADTANATANFYYAVALLKTERATDALPVFKKLAQGGSAYKGDSYFFAALAAYKSGEKNLAKEFAKQVPQASPYYKNARKILKKL